MNEAMPVSAMVIVAIERIPLMMTGIASGMRILRMIWPSVEPIPRAASMMPGSMLVRPV